MFLFSVNKSVEGLYWYHCWNCSYVI